MNASTKWKLVRILFTAVYLFAGWLLFTASLDLSSVLLGIALSSIVSLVMFDLFIQESEVARRSLVPHLHLFVLFILVVLFKMYVASFKVAWNVIRGRINPRIVHFRTRLRTDMSRVVLTNAITLTPGTITLNLDDDHLIVHWLDAKTTHSKYAGKLIKGSFEKLLGRIWV